MKNRFLTIVVFILLLFALTSCDDKTINQIKTLQETIEYLNNLKEKYESNIVELNNFIKKLKIEHKNEIKNIKAAYEDKLKESSVKYHELMAERDLLKKTVKKLKKENEKLKNRADIVKKKMF